MPVFKWSLFLYKCVQMNFFLFCSFIPDIIFGPNTYSKLLVTTEDEFAECGTEYIQSD